ncbi:MAG: amidohydrolase family protein, partial [Bacteroidota bacterium]
MIKITADLICPVSAPALTNGVLILEDSGKILAIEKMADHDTTSVKKHQGVLVPGFVNTHCHLELSHMKGKVDTGTSLIPFITNVVKFRDVPQEQIDAAIVAGDREMYEAGIVAVGDISNKTDTAAVKNESRIRYYTFVEMFDFIQDAMAQQEYDKYHQVYEAQAGAGGNRKSCVPHAPYTVSPTLFELINKANQKKATTQTISIHNQETPPEDQLFQKKAGAFLDFYGGFNISLDAFEPTGQSSIHYAM